MHRTLPNVGTLERLFGFLSQEEKKKKSIEPAFSIHGFNICSAWFKFDTNTLVCFVNVQYIVQVSNVDDNVMKAVYPIGVTRSCSIVSSLNILIAVVILFTLPQVEQKLEILDTT